MKKLMIVVLALVVIAVAAAYILVPSSYKIAASKKVVISPEALTRVLNDTSQWKNWWPGEKENNTYSLNGATYAWTTGGLNRVEMVSKKICTAKGNLSAGLISPDSTLLSITADLSPGYNPVTRIAAYFNHASFKSDFDNIINTIDNYYSKDTNTYQTTFKRATVVDSAFVATSAISASYPTTDFIYGLIDKLTAYIKTHNAVQTAPPMLNVLRQSDGYLVRVALPVNKRLPDTNEFFYKWMPGGGNMLITDVTGGEQKIARAMLQISLYADDHKLIAPAIPYESLITDRRQQPDSNQWQTRIYYPIMWFRN